MSRDIAQVAVARALAIVAAAIALALLSVRIQRTGPEQVVYSNLCGPTASDLCYKPVLNGGVDFADRTNVFSAFVP